MVFKNHKEFIRISKSILKTRNRFKSARHNIFTDKINKIVLSSNDIKRIKSIDWIVTFTYGRSKYLVSEKEEIKYVNIIMRCKTRLNLMIL